MRFSVHPHTDAFVEVIGGALADAAAAGRTEGLVLDTDEVSTYVGARTEPAEQRLVDYLTAVVAAATAAPAAGTWWPTCCSPAAAPVRWPATSP